MNGILAFWQKLTWQRRGILIGVTAAMFFAVLAVARIGSSVDRSLLYAGLESREAGQVIASLDQMGVQYEVRGDSIYVPSQERDSLRMQLAGQGLPASGTGGYELLDGLSGFGTTSQMFDAAYWRAKEGELARTALALPRVRSARVHISPVSNQGFLRESRVAASITLSMASGTVSEEQADALRHLVASAVGGLSADEVSVIDAEKGLISADGESPSRGGASRADAIKMNVQRLLEARVGEGRVIVEVALDHVLEREAITERMIEPSGRVAISSQVESRSESSTETNADVTVASNLPTGSGAGGNTGNSNASSSKESINYEVSETQREILREPGAIRRMTVAVLVDGTRIEAADGTSTWQPRTEEELADLRELVSAAAGIDEKRGDTLTLKSMEFHPVALSGTLAEAGGFGLTGSLDLMGLVKYAVLTVVAAILALFVFRPMVQVLGAQSAPPPADRQLSAPGRSAEKVLTGEIADDDTEPLRFGDALPRLAGERLADDPVSRLKRLMDERQEESAEILRGWLEKQEDRA